MSFLLRRERVGVAFAVPAWKEAAQAPVFWEAQEVQCFHEKTGPLGILMILSGFSILGGCFLIVVIGFKVRLRVVRT